MGKITDLDVVHCLIEPGYGLVRRFEVCVLSLRWTTRQFHSSCGRSLNRYRWFRVGRLGGRGIESLTLACRYGNANATAQNKTAMQKFNSAWPHTNTDSITASLAASPTATRRNHWRPPTHLPEAKGMARQEQSPCNLSASHRQQAPQPHHRQARTALVRWRRP